MISRTISALLFSVFAFFAGAYADKNNLPPTPQMRKMQLLLLSAQYDDFTRLTAHGSKITRPCPTQDARTGVILAIGQSNAANNGERYSTLTNDGQIFNYWNGACYDAVPPLLGASGKGGSFIPMLADKLISTGVYDKIVIVSSGVGSTNIARWGAGGDLHLMLRDVVRGVASHYAITEVIWHQGESDFIANTSTSEYENQFRSLSAMLAAASPTPAPIYLAVASKCDASKQKRWQAENPVTQAQRNLLASGVAILGAESDRILHDSLRLPDRCHMNYAGEVAMAEAYAGAIKRRH
jgi:hypothetical protein